MAPGVPHHVTQRGNRRQQTFFCDEDYKAYLHLLAQWCSQWKVEIWAYCLMPNHVHLIVVPPSKEALTRAIAETHRRYTSRVNLREGWTGHLWQGRFSSFPLSEAHLYSAASYVERNPVRAGLVKEPWQYPWSSAAAHLAGYDNQLVRVGPLLEMFGDWREYLTRDIPEEDVHVLLRHERTGRPLGDETFLVGLEEALGQSLQPRKRGPRRKD
ncbi:MAG: Transposase [Desulfotomaculum sp. 46_296]|nr:MAG: Transposase [Desulfotomaculum sp. 46_296]